MKTIKKILSIVLCIVFSVSCAPTMNITASAEGFGDKGYDTNLYETFIIDTLSVYAYITGYGGVVERISGSDSDSVQQYRAVANDNWEFAYWSTYYYGPITQATNVTAVLGYYYFSKPGDKESVYDKTNPVIQINEEMWAQGEYYIQAIFKPKLRVNMNEEISTMGFWGTSHVTADGVFVSNNGKNSFVEGYMPFGGTAEINAVVDDYVVESVSVHDGVERNDFTYNVDSGWVKIFTGKITYPTNVQINVRPKKQNVSFNANGGEGIMSDMVFENNIEKALPENTFAKKCCIFDSWNTESDGSGISYTDSQGVIFTPENDGDSVTLYAQWKESEHNWSVQSYDSNDDGTHYENYLCETDNTHTHKELKDCSFENGVCVCTAKQKLSVNVKANSSKGGKVYGGGTYAYGEVVCITAEENDKYNFVRWEENGVEVSTEATCCFEIFESRNLVAVFEEDPAYICNGCWCHDMNNLIYSTVMKFLYSMLSMITGMEYKCCPDMQ